jgi:large subunit ribosomal protein L3
MFKSIIGKKIGMTQVFDDKGNLIPVTVVKAGPCVITDVKTKEKDGYSAVQLSFGDIDEKKLNKSQFGVFNKNNISPNQISREF